MVRSVNGTFGYKRNLIDYPISVVYLFFIFREQLGVGVF